MFATSADERSYIASVVTVVLLTVLNCSAQDASESLQNHSAVARAAQERGDFETAAAEWQAIVRIAPNMAEASNNLGMMWHFGHHYEKAIEAFKKAIQLNPNLVGPQLFLGIDYYLISRPKEAISQLNRAVALDPRNALALKWLGISYIQVSDYVKAAIVLQRATAADSSDPDLLFWLSRACAKVLFECYRNVQELSPDSPYLKSLREQSAGEKLSPQTPGESLALLRDLVRKDPHNVEHWYRLGMCSKTLALASLDSFLTRAPSGDRVHVLQAEYFLALGNEERAMSEYREALAVKSDAIQINQAIGNIFMSHHDYANAIQSYNAELRVDPYSLVSLERIGQAYAELNNAERANEYLARAIAIDPRSYEGRRALGKIFFARGDYRAAVENYRAALQNRPERDSSVLFLLSNAYRRTGEKVQADRLLAQFKRERGNELNRVQKDMRNRVSATPSSEPSKDPVLP